MFGKKKYVVKKKWKMDKKENKKTNGNTQGSLNFYERLCM